MLSHEREHAQIPVGCIKMSGVQEEGEHGLTSTSWPQCNVSLSFLGGRVFVTLLDPWILYKISYQRQQTGLLGCVHSLRWKSGVSRVRQTHLSLYSIHHLFGILKKVYL